ncbi:hypothetical protein [Ruminococcus sp. NK3A76]|uniref:hypothetical protein n=1 Tax=Ruminococcus sp. NK3A76 TaxID=877411 RepID=UPI00048A9DCF|nr:hypothetical protein [Ruminococcus sp. NK3A76]
MNKYRLLAINTVVFTLGSFGSKIISLLLNNLYTKHISPNDMFKKSMLETLALFLIPVFTFAITESVIRFGLDKHYNKSVVHKPLRYGRDRIYALYYSFRSVFVFISVYCSKS